MTTQLTLVEELIAAGVRTHIARRFESAILTRIITPGCKPIMFKIAHGGAVTRTEANLAEFEIRTAMEIINGE